MRYVLILLGLVTVVLAVVLAREGLWWAAIPDGAFGVGVAWVAYVSLRDEPDEPRSPGTPFIVPGSAPPLPTPQKKPDRRAS